MRVIFENRKPWLHFAIVVRRLAVPILVFLTVLFPIVVIAQEPTPAIEILSKEDTRAMFSMTNEQWHANVQQAIAAGAALPMGTSKTGFGMAVNMPGGDLLLVRPIYINNEQRPDFIQVTVGYRYQKAALLTDPALKDAIRMAKNQMEPEYDVIGNVERSRDEVAVFFIITEKILG